MTFWDQNGALSIFGYPITFTESDATEDTGQRHVTQWFERARLELHPRLRAPYDVLLGRLGAERLLQLGVDWWTLPAAPARTQGCLYFEETRHNLCNQQSDEGFMHYWSTNGLEFDGLPGTSHAESLALFGYPLTEAYMETNPDGDIVLTQWFERARFEWHPNNRDQYSVLLGRLGAEVLAANRR